MRKAHADYTSIDKALLPYQKQTLQDYASAKGSSNWWDEAVCCAIALVLAVANDMNTRQRKGLSQRQALLRTAADFDVDPGTIERQLRSARRRTSPA